MEPSSNNDDKAPAPTWLVRADRTALVGLALGLALYVFPVWQGDRLAVAFWMTISSTLLHVYTSHRRGSAESDYS